MDHKQQSVGLERPADAPALSSDAKGRRSGEGMESLVRHLREHLREQNVEQVPEDRATDRG